MAEYIDRILIPYAKTSNLDKGSLTTRELVESVPIADVVERFKYEMMAERCKTMTKAFIELQKDNKDLQSKLDKAIQDIKLEKHYLRHENIELDKMFDKGLDKALEILKRNIG